MLVNVLDAEAERRHGQEAAAFGKELAEMKQHLVLAGRHACALRDGMIERAVGTEPPVGDALGIRIDPPYLDAQPLRRAAARHIDRVNGNATCHDVPPLSTRPW